MSKKKIKHQPNLTQGEEHSLPCISCVGQTDHKVVASFDTSGSEDDEDYNFSWSVYHQIVQCLGCKTISFRKASSNSEDYVQTGPDDYDSKVIEELYPSRKEGRKGIGDDAVYLPINIRKIYEETLFALTNGAQILAGIGLRALLEAVCIEKKATGRDLYKKIENLVTLNVLTPINATILHKIRAIGNSAAHEVKPQSAKQLGLAMDIIEHLLKVVYILPLQADSEFDK
jgi:hypothetical protein